MKKTFTSETEYTSYADEIQCKTAGYKATWSLGLAEYYLTTENVDSSMVQLGNVDIADAQRKEEEAAGGIVAYLMNRN